MCEASLSHSRSLVRPLLALDDDLLLPPPPPRSESHKPLEICPFSLKNREAGSSRSVLPPPPPPPPFPSSRSTSLRLSLYCPLSFVSNSFTSMKSPSFTTSLTFATRVTSSSLTWQSPSTPGKISTNAPNVARWAVRRRGDFPRAQRESFGGKVRRARRRRRGQRRQRKGAAPCHVAKAVIREAHCF